MDLARLAGLYPGRGHLRGHERGRDRWPACRGSRSSAARHGISDAHHRGPHPLPHAAREARPQDRGGRPAHQLRRVPHPRLREPIRGEHHVALVKGDVGPSDDGARAGPLPVPDRRHLRLGPLRLRRSSCPRHGDDQKGGQGRPPLPEPRGPGHRPGQQDPGLRLAGQGRRHGRGQPRLGFKPDQRDYGIGAQILVELGSAGSACSPTTRGSSSAWPATAWRSSSACRSRCRPGRRTSAT